MVLRFFAYKSLKPCRSSSLKFKPLDKGFLGFEDSASILLPQEDSASLDLGKIAWGGANQQFRVYVSLNSTGSKHLDLSDFKNFLSKIGARITRLDIAVDDYKGNYSVPSAKQIYQSGQFTTTAGRPPKAKFIDDMG